MYIGVVTPGHTGAACTLSHAHALHAEVATITEFKVITDINQFSSYHVSNCYLVHCLCTDILVLTDYWYCWSLIWLKDLVYAGFSKLSQTLHTYVFGNISKVKVIFRQNLSNGEWTEVPCKFQGQKQALKKSFHVLEIQTVWQNNVSSSFQHVMARVSLYKQNTPLSPAGERSWKTALMEAGGLPWSQGTLKCRRAKDLFPLHPSAEPMARSLVCW